MYVLYVYQQNDDHKTLSTTSETPLRSLNVTVIRFQPEKNPGDNPSNIEDNQKHIWRRNKQLNILSVNRFLTLEVLFLETPTESHVKTLEGMGKNDIKFKETERYAEILYTDREEHKKLIVELLQNHLARHLVRKLGDKFTQKFGDLEIETGQHREVSGISASSSKGRCNLTTKIILKFSWSERKNPSSGSYEPFVSLNYDLKTKLTATKSLNGLMQNGLKNTIGMEVRSKGSPDKTGFVVAASGLKWQIIGATQPTEGRELTNLRLSKSLISKLEFTENEWNAFAISHRDLRHDDFIKSGSSFFKLGQPGVIGDNITLNGITESLLDNQRKNSQRREFLKHANVSTPVSCVSIQVENGRRKVLNYCPHCLEPLWRLPDLKREDILKLKKNANEWHAESKKMNELVLSCTWTHFDDLKFSGDGSSSPHIHHLPPTILFNGPVTKNLQIILVVPQETSRNHVEKFKTQFKDVISKSRHSNWTFVETIDYSTKFPDEAGEQIKQDLKQVQNIVGLKIVLVILPPSFQTKYRLNIKNAVSLYNLGAQCVESKNFVNINSYTMENIILQMCAKVGNPHKICCNLSPKGTYHVSIDVCRNGVSTNVGSVVVFGSDGQFLHCSSTFQIGETCNEDFFEKSFIPGLRAAKVCQCDTICVVACTYTCECVCVRVCVCVCVCVFIYVVFVYAYVYVCLTVYDWCDQR